MTELREKVRIFLQAEFPQIRMHGGSFDVQSVDESSGEIELLLGDACGGCGISPMTQQQIQKRMPKAIEEVELVRVDFETEDITEGPF